MEIEIRYLSAELRVDWLRLRRELWPEADDAEARAWEFRDDAVTLLAVTPELEVVGFAEAGVRPYADGCETTPVAFLEGWFVGKCSRGRGVGAKLIEATLDWARKRGLEELASDSLLEDGDAYRAHLHVGFEEVERSIKYRMTVAQGAG